MTEAATSTRVATPCIAVCDMDGDTGLCKGCYRNIDEIERWLVMSQAERRETVDRAAARKRQALA
jgi:predicted Fe-S protein YdhL (DUF1289 family)